LFRVTVWLELMVPGCWLPKLSEVVSTVALMAIIGDADVEAAGVATLGAAIVPAEVAPSVSVCLWADAGIAPAPLARVPMASAAATGTVQRAPLRRAAR
jgi:hypothetical protein